MSIIFLGDEHHRYFQDTQLETLKNRKPEILDLFWSTQGLAIFSQLDELAKKSQKKLVIVASRHGAIPAVHWTARNPDSVRRLILLHPSLHLNAPGLEAPSPHFVSTMVICHSKVPEPSHEKIAELAGKLFHEYSFHLTSEPAELTASLQLLSL